MSATTTGAPQPRERWGWRRYLSVTVTAVAFAYLAAALRSNWATLADFDWRPGPADIVALGLFSAAVPLSGVLWGRILGELTEVSLRTRTLVSVHIESWLLRYIPGQVAGLARKVAWGKQRGVPTSAVTASFTYDFLFHLCASAVIGLPVALLGVSDSGAGYTALLVLVGVAQLAILGLPLAFRLVPSGIGERLRTSLIGLRVSLRLQVWYLMPRLLNAAGFVVLAVRFGAISGTTDVLSVGAVYVLAGAVGILAFLVPSGLGVREAVIIAALGPAIGESAALVLAITARFIAVAADVVLVGVLIVLKSMRERTTAQDSQGASPERQQELFP